MLASTHWVYPRTRAARGPIVRRHNTPSTSPAPAGRNANVTLTGCVSFGPLLTVRPFAAWLPSNIHFLRPFCKSLCGKNRRGSESFGRGKGGWKINQEVKHTFGGSSPALWVEASPTPRREGRRPGSAHPNQDIDRPDGPVRGSKGCSGPRRELTPSVPDLESGARGAGGPGQAPQNREDEAHSTSGSRLQMKPPPPGSHSGPPSPTGLSSTSPSPALHHSPPALPKASAGSAESPGSPNMAAELPPPPEFALGASDLGAFWAL